MTEPSGTVTGSGQFRVGPELRTGVIETQKGAKAVLYTVVDGEPMVEGDIVLTLVQEGEVHARGVVIPGQQFRWPGGRVPFEIDPALPDQARVHNAIAH
ncbi:hypothetical protein SAMN04488074_101454 [Lentzea albidocapillata subsp. violacea]|uniref:Uncharacterized protein n=1 Tax=Lentzea albidocapillata subsp. violacea TaxID=128104 RepID=A0A1G8QUQ1_9PSEU|nr:hypothetical protein [Lentzea albidocapillata]SDJ08035.1 hypothetical protein SAMN04488074_101454 [Lentzea albidocapillata subsp. violacea]